VDQSSKTKKLLGDQILNFGPDFLKTNELWSTFFGIMERSVNGLRHVKILWAKVQKQQSYELKTLKLWGMRQFGGP